MGTNDLKFLLSVYQGDCEGYLKRFKKFLALKRWNIKIKVIKAKHAKKIKELKQIENEIAGLCGYTLINYKRKQANIYVTYEQIHNAEDLKNTVLHELLHVMLARLTFRLKGGPREELIEEKLVCELTKALLTTGV